MVSKKTDALPQMQGLKKLLLLWEQIKCLQTNKDKKNFW